jgi:hypothetical protein
MNKNLKNFGKIKNVYNTILIESISSKADDKKSVFKNYVKTINNDEILKEQFLIYTNIENKIESDRFKATEYVKESISLLSKYDRKKILESNLKLFNEISYELDTNYDKDKLHEAITTLIFTDKKANTLDTIMEATDVVVNYIINNKPKVVNEDLNVPNSLLLSLSVDKFNEEYSNIDESEKKLLQVILNDDATEKESLYKDYINECIICIDDKLVNESDFDIKNKLLNVKDKLLKFNFNNDTFNDDISKILNLKNSLI